MRKEALEEQVKQYGSLEKYREHLATGLANKQAMADVFKWYGGKENTLKATLQQPGSAEEFKPLQDDSDQIYKLFMTAKETDNTDMEKEAVERLAEHYKQMFKLDNARSILLDLAKEYLQRQKLAEGTDKIYGQGCSEYVANAINRYYGI